ncbi:MAG TPA: STAS domain-containing protein [Humisphaera sp.]
MSDAPVQIGPTTEGGLLVRLVGRCTMQHSPAVEELVGQSLARDPTVSAWVDLTACTYLDSTFLGCLFGLYRRFGTGPAPRFHLHIEPAQMKALFGPMRLDKVVRADPAAMPDPAGPLTPIGDAPPDRKALCRHVMECHRRLAETDTPAKVAFTKIADAMEQELAQL